MKSSEFIDRLVKVMDLSDSLEMSSALRGRPEFDSLAIMSILTLIETNFDVFVRATQIAQCEAVSDLIKLIGEENFSKE